MTTKLFSSNFWLFSYTFGRQFSVQVNGRIRQNKSNSDGSATRYGGTVYIYKLIYGNKNAHCILYNNIIYRTRWSVEYTAGHILYTVQCTYTVQYSTSRYIHFHRNYSFMTVVPRLFLQSAPLWLRLRPYTIRSFYKLKTIS